MKNKSHSLLEKYTLQYGATNPILRISCDEVVDFNHDIKELAQDMQKLQRLYHGTWLAAPQIGIPLQIATTIQRKKKWNNMIEIGETVLINPKIISESDEVFASEESCLSLPDFVWFVNRKKKILVAYQDIYGNHKKKEFSDYNAAVVQHEIDHLHGVLFVDKLITKDKKIK